MRDEQLTIKNSAGVSGTGLHGGMRVKIEFFPARPDSGIIIKNSEAEQRLGPGCVSEVNRGTSIFKGRKKILTVEHVISAIRGARIDNIIIHIEGNEPPALDGSAAGFVKALKKAGLKRQGVKKKQIKLKAPIAAADNGAYMAVIPSDRFKVYYFADFSDKRLPAGGFFFDSKSGDYEKEIAPARTFGFKEELGRLIKAGLIKGAAPENAVLFDKGRLVKGRLRFKDEHIRHKVLDVIGDFGMLGANLDMTVFAVKTGHRHNIEMTKRIIKQNSGKKPRQKDGQ